DRVVDAERALQVERAAGAVAERHRARDVQGAAVEGSAQDEPPVEDVGDGSEGLIELAARAPARRGLLVVHEVVELTGCQANVRRAVASAGPGLDTRTGPAKRPGLAIRLHRQRSQCEQTCARSDGGGAAVEEFRKLPPEEVPGIDR